MLITEGELRFASDPLPYQRPAGIYHTTGGLYGHSRFRLSVGTPYGEAVPQPRLSGRGEGAAYASGGRVRGLAVLQSTGYALARLQRTG